MNPRPLIITCLLASLAVQSVIAHDEDHGPYFNVDLGVARVDDVKLKEFPGAGPGTKLEFDPGLRLSYGGGYRLKEWLSLGLESGLIANSIKDADAALVQVPLMGNIELRLPNKSPLVPFIGGGPGASISVIGLDKESLGGGTTVDGADADAVFAWQVYGGVRVKIGHNISLGAVYKYYSANAPTWEVGGTSENIRIGRTRTHSISASFRMDF